MGLVDKIIYGFYTSEFGEMCVAQTDRGLCWFGFVRDGQSYGDIQAFLKQKFSEFSLFRNDAVADNSGRKVMRAWHEGQEHSVEVAFYGTDFQIEVWRTLRDIGRGYVCSYSEIAQMILKPKAVRAVGAAVGANPVSIIVPCHRIVPKSGTLGNYGWGPSLKKKLLLAEGVSETLLM